MDRKMFIFVFVYTDKFLLCTPDPPPDPSAEVSPHSLHQARVTLVNLTSCRSSWGEGLIRDSHLCAHPAAAVSCVGDAGAPLVCQKHGLYFLFGVVTWGSMHCDLNKPAVFSSIADVQLWITDTINDL
ncbi:Chymotrypsin B [Merluccius polli]|uniref:Chymotrypsin B n=1 Tax=Merluccius polli TaxID=89951 RepID=A0AA47MEG2_MERPO|nr:Chymotrypsin B [Merluccius polli]